ncbi:putative ATPase/DNA-binding winged helix-turn-helix (wHTH) protein [Inquilinus ginsengisoli]|uniref:ATPase/DNA-binding winged helix-turn-helix (WHTH) protein n=1 Tax=Inquilinus ginsengisoli TaxID=363840 RepID=A0ABU1JMI7_9PROT|nr:winged helix-turn-helix domain-containing protein [Inquilinus ginsengisoli]MDR6289553.1 putative ATPase/DNA-binding winged helix-turn-helix (wHTH) protein [Inquilinus ginsengisoli]
MERSDSIDGRIFCFGECRFIPDHQLLLHRETPVRVGSRALDLLHALVRRPGDVVRKDELIRFAWPNIFVHEANLKVNIAALRRALSQGQTGLNYIATVPGRGYRFVAPVRVLDPSAGSVLPNPAGSSLGELPVAPMLIGRDEVKAEIVGALAETRLLTIAGPAGVGKTSIAIATARQIDERLKDGVCFIDLATIEDPQLVAPAVAIAAGLDSNLVNVLAGLVEALRNRDMLLVLDNCEHVLSAAAAVADHLNHALPKLLVVATSREPLRCRWESVYRLAPLACPAEENEADTAAAMSFPAVELLVRRAGIHGYRLNKADLPVLAAISRRLDGIALAIELAAPRLSIDGPAALLGLLEHSFEPLASQGGAPTARHMTLMATLDWSYRLLPAREARLLRHLSVFGGKFMLEDVVGVCGDLAAPEDIATWLESVAAKSLLSVSYHNGRRRYRLLDSTRNFASERLRAGGEQQTAMASYARYLLTLFEAAEADWSWRTREDWTARYGHWANDLRRAIDWAFTLGGDAELGVRLTAAAVTFWNEFSSVVECRMRVKAALDAIERLPFCDSILKLKLVAAHAINGCFSSSLGAEVEAALQEGQRMADQLGNVEYRLRATLGLIGVQAFSGRHRDVLSTVAQLRGIIETTGERSAAPDADRHEFTTRFYCGEIEHGHAGLTTLAREHAMIANRSRTSRFQLDRFIAIRNYLAVTTWVIGDHRGALAVARDAVEAGAALDHAVSYTHSLAMAAVPVSLWCGLLDLAQEQVTRLVEKLALRQIDTWPPSARFYQAAIDSARGDANGVERMRRAIDELAACNLRTHFPIRLAMLAEMALAHDRLDLASTSIAKALEYADQRDERWCSAELVRVLGLVRRHVGDAQGAERAFEVAVRIARQSGALSFELRAATNLAELSLQTDRRNGTMEPLRAICERFDTSFESADSLAAHRALGAL